MENSILNLVAAGTGDNILMVEAGANELPEDQMLEALKLAHESMQPVIAIIEAMREQSRQGQNHGAVLHSRSRAAAGSNRPGTERVSAICWPPAWGKWI